MLAKKLAEILKSQNLKFKAFELNLPKGVELLEVEDVEVVGFQFPLLGFSL
ncbi:MAG: hypothetical protein QXK35_04255 [Nitrososphaerales archaeon]